jgi:predicted dehydrogenase
MKTENRRRFIQEAGLAGSSLLILPRHVLGGTGFQAPSDTLNIAGIGVGGMGKGYIDSIPTENISALCDVDDEYAAKTYLAYPRAKRYKDFRVMLEKEKGIDGIMIGTPDHSHALIAMAAMKRGKHVYCAKPLTRTVYEARQLGEATRHYKVATQMSTQGNAMEDQRLLCEWVWDGAIGQIGEVHIWSNRPIWPQGLYRPQEPANAPDTLDWDLWLGPAPVRPYHPAYHPFKFRGWYDFGTGAMGDMGCHGLDPIFKVLKLRHPLSIQASSTPLFPETFPSGSIVHFDFPAREVMVPVRVTWYDGGLRPPRPAELEPGRQLGDWNGGICFKGDKGTIVTTFNGGSPRIIPETKMKNYRRPAKTLPRSAGHYQEWINACKGGPPAGVEFGYGSLLTEVALLGNLAVRTGKKLDWDPVNLKISNDVEANQFINEPYRQGWSL